jgi:hypothetical protein
MQQSIIDRHQWDARRRADRDAMRGYAATKRQAHYYVAPILVEHLLDTLENLIAALDLEEDL